MIYLTFIMKFQKIISVIALSLFTTMITAQTLPNRALGTPIILTGDKKDKADKWEVWCKNKNNILSQFGERNNSPWTVYIDQDNVPAYESASMSSTRKSTLRFMQKAYIAEVKNGYALLFTQAKKFSGLNIDKNAKVFGWVDIDNLLLWELVPTTSSHVEKKALIMQDLDENTKIDRKNNSPFFLRSPRDGAAETDNQAKRLKFYFVLKEKNGFLLLADNNNIGAQQIVTSTVLGWQPKSKCTEWTNRLCLEVNYLAYKNKSILDEPAVVGAKTQAIAWYNGTKPDSTYADQEIPEKPKQRTSPYSLRLPITETVQNYQDVFKVGCIYAGNSGTTTNTIVVDETFAKILNTKLNNINIVFVIDATNSMERCFPAVSKAIDNFLNLQLSQNKNIHIGAVTYRNYADKNKIEKLPLQTGVNKQIVSQWIKSVKPGSVGRSHEELMYDGLGEALKMFNGKEEQQNFIILIGDAANDDAHSTYKQADIIDMIVKKNVSFVGMQVHRNAQQPTAYLNYVKQIETIMSKSLQNMTDSESNQANKKTLRINKKYLLETIEVPFGKTCIASVGFSYLDQATDKSAEEITYIAQERLQSFVRQANDLLASLTTIHGRKVSQKDKAYLRKILKKSNPKLTDREIEDWIDKEDIKVSGYTILRSKKYKEKGENYQLWLADVFITDDELKNLISNLNVFNKIDGAKGKREVVQDAFAALARTYVGDPQMPLQQIMDAIIGLPQGVNNSKTWGKITIVDLDDENKVSLSTITEMIESLRNGLKRLEEIKENPTYFFVQEGLKFYYIPVREMPQLP